MDIMPDGFNEIASAIRLALAPAFLLTGIAGMLNVMAGRLTRIIDRDRSLAVGISQLSPEEQDEINAERKCLLRRRHYTSVAITAGTIAALFICLVIAILFLEVMLNAPLMWLVGGLFASAMLSLVVGLAFFLREVHLAMRIISRTRRKR